MQPNSKTFRIFVSSTFSDLKTERNALQERVFPRLRELCQRHDARFQAIDLRWGVSEEASLDQQTMNICLREIERSQKITPRPNFVVLMGDRYGWYPPPPQIPASEFNNIVELGSKSDKDLLSRWYRLDENAVPPEYVLQPRQRGQEYEQHATWSVVEKRLHAVLAQAARLLDLRSDQTLKYEASATHQEIALGALAVPDAAQHVYCFFRCITNLPEDRSIKDFVDLDEDGKFDKTAADRLSRLKTQLENLLGKKVFHYDAEWTGKECSSAHIDRLCNDVYQSLAGVIEHELAVFKAIDPLQAEIDAHAAFGDERAKFFTGRKAALDAIEKYLNRRQAYPFVIWGVSGSGKSALMARAIQKSKAAQVGAKFVCRFIGATPDSTGGRDLLEGLCREISRQYGVKESDIPNDYRELVKAFPKKLALASAKQPLILFLDALDQLSEANRTRSLLWLPYQLPEHVHIVLSSLEGEALEVLKARLSPENILQLGPMPVTEAGELLDLWLDDAHRKLQAQQKQSILQKYAGCSQPLYLKLVFDIARRWKSYEPAPTLSNSIPGIIHDLFKRLASDTNHGKAIVAGSLGYLAAAKNGLTEDELLDILALDQNVYLWFLSSLFHTPSDLLTCVQSYLKTTKPAGGEPIQAEAWLARALKEENKESLRMMLSEVHRTGGKLRIPIVLWSRLYWDLEPYLRQVAADGANLLGFYHQQIFEAAAEEYLSGEDGLAKHVALSHYFSEQRLQELQNGAPIYNQRKLSELPYQQAQGQLWPELQTTLTDFDFLKAKTIIAGPQALITDYAQAYRSGYVDSDLQQVEDAIQLSEQILVNDKKQLAAQLVGRLMNVTSTGSIQRLISQAKAWREAPWLCPLRPALIQSGGTLVRSLGDHDGVVTSLAFSQNGRRLVAGCMDGCLYTWDVQHAELVDCAHIPTHQLDAAIADNYDRSAAHRMGDLRSGLQLKETDDGPCSVRMSPDGRTVVFRLIRDQSLWVWDLQTNRRICYLRGHTGHILCATTTPDGSRVISGGVDGTVQVWELSNQHRGVLEPSHTLVRHDHFVTCVAATADNRYAVSGSLDKTICIWSLDNGKLVRTIHTGNPVRLLAVTNDNQRIVSAGDAALQVWDFNQGVSNIQAMLGKGMLCRLSGFQGGVTALAVTPGTNLLVTASQDLQLKVWDIRKGTFLYNLEEHLPGYVTDIAISPDGNQVTCALTDRTVLSWKLAPTGLKRPAAAFTGHVHTVAITPDARLAVSGSTDGTVRVWDLQQMAVRHEFHGHEGPVMTVAISPAGDFAISAGLDKLVHGWNLLDGKPKFALRGHHAAIHTLALTKDGRYALSGSEDGTLIAWDTIQGKALETLSHHEGTVSAVAISPTGERAISAGVDGTLRVWNLDRSWQKSGADSLVKMLAISSLAQNSPRILAQNVGIVNSLAISPGGKLAVSASRQGELAIWDLEALKKQITLVEEGEAIWSVSLNADEPLCCLSVRARNLELWDVHATKKISAFSGDGDFVSCAISVDGKRLVAGDTRGQFHVFSLLG